MSIAKALIEQMGGTLEVTSGLGVGSTFVATIPFEIADRSELAHSEPEGPVSIDGMNILLSEDNELNREIAKTILEEGDSIIAVIDGQDAEDDREVSPR